MRIKTAKPLSPAAARPEPGKPKAIRPKVEQRAPRRSAAAAAGADTPSAIGITEGQVIGVSGPGLVRAVLSGGRAVDALCPAHVDLAWLKEACAAAPVPAAFVVARPSGRQVLWGLFPTPAHAEVRAEIVIRGRQVKIDAESVQVRARDAYLDLDSDGNVALKGRDVTSHARRVNRIKGGSIRLN